MHYIIGCGGTGSWLAPALCTLLLDNSAVCFVDGDTLEKKNLSRQFFSPDFIGTNKATALAKLYPGAEAWRNYYSAGCIAHTDADWLWACVDNNAARKAVFSAADEYGCNVIVSANEQHSAEALIYLPRLWRDTACDPRRFYPEWLTDDKRDPEQRAIGCTGVAQVETPQLVTANFTAAALALKLYVLWGMEWPRMDNRVRMAGFMPHRLATTLSGMEHTNVSDTLNPEHIDEAQPLPANENF